MRSFTIAALLAFIVSLPLSVAVAGCWSPGPPPQPPKPEPVEGATCASACDRFRELGCPEGEDTAGGGTCEEVCQNVQDSGIIEWDLECRTGVDACDQVDSCED